MTAPRLRAAAVLTLAALVLTGAAAWRGAEYDEQYTVFLLAGDARPVWPDGVFPAGAVRDRFQGTSSFARIASDLRRHDVHPPLYFWAASVWRAAVGDTLFRLRLFSVLCGVAALATVGLIARRIGVPPALAMLLTLGCYAFAYTGSVARGFALAQLLALLGILAALSLPLSRTAGEGRALRSSDGRLRVTDVMSAVVGLLLGAASFANYLAAFASIPVLVWLSRRRLRDGMAGAAGVAIFVAADLCFFLAQRNSRTGQFPPFHLLGGLLRLAKYGASSVAGGLPLYVPAPLAAPVGAASALAVTALVLLVVARWRHIATPAARALLGGAALATPLGLVALGMVFDNTPIELRYLAFATPYAALLLAGAIASLPRRGAMAWSGAAVALQAAAIAGLLARPETMQPMRAVARQAARLTDAVVLVPRGNDGVGIVGAFVSEMPAAARLLLIDPDTRAAALRAVGPRVALALLGRDAQSRATLTAVQGSLAADPCWRRVPGGSTLAVFETTCGDGGWVSSTASR